MRKNWYGDPMKKTQLTDAIRNIVKQKVSYLSVVLIALLGVASFLSISYASASMQENCSEHYAEMRFRNVEVISSMMLSPGDLDALRSVEGVRDVEAFWQADCNIYIDGKPQKAVFLTLGKRINLPLVKEGRLPQNTAECAVESRIAEAMDLQVGDVIEAYDFTDDMGQYSAISEPITVTGIVEHPDHLSLNLNETGYILVDPSVFDHEAMDGCFVKAEILLDSLPDENCFSERSLAVSDEAVRRIEALAAERTPLRDETVREQAYAALDSFEQSLRGYLADALRERDALLADPSVSREELEEIEERISDLEESLGQMDQQREKVKTIASRWIVLGEKGSPSFVQLLAGSENLGSLRMTFALMFIVISALVIYATVSKMVDEQRTLVGTAKALGFHKREILQKYLIYGVSGTLAGSLLGVLAARFPLEGIALSGYGKYVSVDITTPRFFAGITLVVLLAVILISAAAVCFACSRLVRTPAVALMQPPVPKGKARSEKQKKHLLPLYSRLILRNIRSDWGWIAVTLVSVAGCCALLVNGFTLKHGVTGCVANQYGRIVDYDWEVDCWDYAVPDIRQALNETGAEAVDLYQTTLVTKIGDTGIINLLCGDLKEINKVFHLYDWKTGEPITEADKGILIQRRLAEIYGLDIGSEFEVSEGLGNLVTVPVAGVFENYIGLPAVMSDSCYEELFGKTCDHSSIFLRLNGADEAALTALLNEQEGVKTFGAPERSTFKSSTTVINAIVALLTVMAALLAGVVLMNLTNFFFLQKKREMYIMRINGFTVKQTVWYLLREIIPTLEAGIILGIAAGAFMGYGILRAMEQTFVQFDRSISLPAWALGAGITLLFTVIINWLVLRKVRQLKLTDAAV